MKRSLFWAAFAVIVAAWVQGALISRWSVGAEYPDLILVTILLVALIHGREAGLVAGVTGGLLLGWLTGFAGAAFFLSTVAVAYGVSLLKYHWHLENLFVRLLAVFLGSLGAAAMFVFLYPQALHTPDLLVRVTLRATLNAALALPAGAVVARLPLPRDASS